MIKINANHGGFVDGGSIELAEDETICEVCRYAYHEGLGYCPTCKMDQCSRDTRDRLLFGKVV